MSCIGFTNPTQRVQIASKEACESKLPFTKVFRSEGKIERLHNMARDGDTKVRAAAASNPMLALVDMIWLAADPDDSVRSWVLRNPNVTDTIKRWLSSEDNEKSPAIRVYAKFLLKED